MNAWIFAAAVSLFFLVSAAVCLAYFVGVQHGMQTRDKGRKRVRSTDRLMDVTKIGELDDWRARKMPSGEAR